jgi:putative phosphoribosyl transferase
MICQQSIPITVAAGTIHADLDGPDRPQGLVVFAHGSGSSRHSPRNRYVAEAQRLGAATEWARSDPNTAALPVGYFGASTGAGAALLAAARDPDRISAVVSRGGRPDLAGPALARVRAPTLLIVGGQDPVVVELNQHAAAQLQCAHELVVVPRATHLFEEPGTLDQAAELAGDWFAQHLRISVASPVGGSSP